MYSCFPHIKSDMGLDQHCATRHERARISSNKKAVHKSPTPDQLDFKYRDEKQRRSLEDIDERVADKKTKS